MKPDASRVLEHTATTLLTEIAPALPVPYQQTTAGALGAMLGVVREELERAAARRVAESEALRALFRDAEAVVADDALRARLAEAAAGRDESLLVADLEAGNQALRALLVELHAHVEELAEGGSDAARALDEAIWHELVLSTERRRVAMSAL